jgi:hypothetical protein
MGGKQSVSGATADPRGAPRAAPKSGKHRARPGCQLVATLLHAAATERYWLAERRPSWRCEGRRLAYYRTVPEWAEGESVALGALFAAHPELAGPCAAHDRAVAALLVAASRAHDALLGDPRFVETVRSAHAERRRADGGARTGLAAAIAEHVVNALPPEPAGWASPEKATPPDRALWCAAAARFVAHRDHHRREMKAVDRALDELTEATNELERALRALAA